MKWIAVSGHFDISEKGLVFHGEPTPWKDEQGNEQIGYAVGIAISTAYFTGGELAARVRFHQVADRTACELVFYWDSANQARLSAGIGPPLMFAIRSWDGKSYNEFAFSGDRRNLKPNRDYDLRVTVHGSRVRLFVDDVEVLSTVLPFTVSPSQPGIFCFDQERIDISRFRADARKGRVFAVMQLSSPYREIYEDVVRKICEENYDIRNAEEIYGPGLIMADVAQDIEESEFVVADITPSNPNVYYEVGYAHALGKPVIMIADEQHLSKIPFDVAAARVILYKNTIAGKRNFEEAFRRSLVAIEQKRSLPANSRGITRR
jgi:hypothetical protein